VRHSSPHQLAASRGGRSESSLAVPGQHCGSSLRAVKRRSLGVRREFSQWRELAKLQDITLRTIYETTATREELQVAVAILSPSGLRFLEEHDPESGEPTEEG